MIATDLSPWSSASDRRIPAGTDCAQPATVRPVVLDGGRVALPLAAADGAGHSRAAAARHAPVSTLRDWIRAVRRDVPALIGHAVRLLQTAGDPNDAWPTPSRPIPPLAAALNALGAAARDVASWLARPDATAPGLVTGVDYLGLLRRGQRHDLVRRMRLAALTLIFQPDVEIRAEWEW